MPDDLKIEKAGNKELRVTLSGNNKVTKSTVTVEDLYEQLGKYLQSKKSGPAGAADCGVNYA
jgi:hypothetical protein